MLSKALCEKCAKENGKTAFEISMSAKLTPCRIMYLVSCEDDFAPNGCPYVLEHMVMGQRENLEKELEVT